MKPIRILAAAVFGSMLTVPALAQPGGYYSQAPAPRFDARLQHQADRIQAGLDAGALTRREARQLVDEQARLQRRLVDVRADRRVQPYEREQLRQAFDAQDRLITAELTDREHRRDRRYSR